MVKVWTEKEAAHHCSWQNSNYQLVTHIKVNSQNPVWNISKSAAYTNIIIRKIREKERKHLVQENYYNHKNQTYTGNSRKQKNVAQTTDQQLWQHYISSNEVKSNEFWKTEATYTTWTWDSSLRTFHNIYMEMWGGIG